MGNVAIAFIQSTISFSDYLILRRQKRIEHKRLRTLIPRYLARLNSCDSLSITTLNLNNLGVDNQILRLLSSALLSGKTRVQELSLERNWIGSEGATVIARVLSKDGNLRDVSLAHNPVGSVGAMALASALLQNTTLERLDLSHCDIDDDGISKLAHSLSNNFNATLKYLYLEGNYISSVGVCSLLKCVYDTSRNMQSLWESNHSLRAFYGQRSIYSPSFPETIANRELIRQLGEILATCNRRFSMPDTSNNSTTLASSTDSANKIHARIAACKILRHYVVKRDTSEYWDCVEGMEEKLVPNVVGWLVRYADVGVIYGVVRDMPWLLEKKTRKEEADGTRKIAAPNRVGEKNALLEEKECSMVDGPSVLENEGRRTPELVMS